MVKEAKICEKCLNNFHPRYFPEHKCKPLRSFRLLKDNSQGRYLAKCEVHGCSWKGRRDRAGAHRQSCKLEAAIKQPVVKQEACSIPIILSINENHFRQFAVGRDEMALIAKLKILAFGLLLKVTRYADPYGNWYCGRTRVKTKNLTIFLMNHYHWVSSFEDELRSIVNEVAMTRTYWTEVRNWDNLYFRWAAELATYNCKQFVEHLFSLPFRRVPNKILSRDPDLAKKRRDLATDRHRVTRGIKVEVANRRNVSYRDPSGEKFCLYRRVHHRRLTSAKYAFMDYQVRLSNERYEQQSKLNRSRCLKNEAQYVREEEQIFFKRTLRQFAIDLSAYQILLFSSEDYSKYVEANRTYSTEEQLVLQHIKAVGGILTYGNPGQVANQWLRIQPFWGRQRHPLGEFDKLYPTFLHFFKDTLLLYCLDQAKKYARGHFYSIPYDTETLINMFTHQGKYIEENQSDFTRNFLLSVQVKLASMVKKFIGGLMNYHQPEIRFGKNSITFDSDCERLLVVAESEGDAEYIPMPWERIISKQDCEEAYACSDYLLQSSQVAFHNLDRVYLPRKCLSYEICPQCRRWINTTHLRCKSCGVSYHQSCLKFSVICHGCSYSVNEMSPAWLKQNRTRESLFKQTQNILTEPSDKYSLTERKFSMRYDLGIRINPSYNYSHFAVPSPDDEKIIECFEYFNCPVEFDSCQCWSTRKILRHEMVYMVEGQVLRKSTYRRCRMSETRELYLVLALGPTAKECLYLIPHDQRFIQAVRLGDIISEHDDSNYNFNINARYMITQKGPRLIFIANRTIQQRERISFPSRMRCQSEIWFKEEEKTETSKWSSIKEEAIDEYGEQEQGDA